MQSSEASPPDGTGAGASLPRVSVVIPTYNRGRYLARAIRSALEQLEPGDELIVVDDGSTDDTPAVLAEFGSAITVLKGAHAGAGPARNLGIEHAGNELVAFLDSDDTWLPGKLQLQRRLMAARPELLFCFGNFQVAFADGRLVDNYLSRWPRQVASLAEDLGPGRPYSSYAPLPAGCADFPVREGDFYARQLNGFYILTDTLMVRRAAAGEALRFAVDLPTYEDLECFYRLARRGLGALLDVELARQFEHGEGRLSDRTALVKLDVRLKLIRRHWGADPAYLSANGAHYQRTLDALLCQKAGHLLTRGETGDARRVLSEASRAPLQLRLLAAMPPALVTAALGLLRAGRKLARRPG